MYTQYLYLYIHMCIYKYIYAFVPMFLTYHLWLITWLYEEEQITCSFGLPQLFMFPLGAVISLPGLAVSWEQDTLIPSTWPYTLSICLNALRSWVPRPPLKQMRIPRVKKKCPPNPTPPTSRPHSEYPKPRIPCPSGLESAFHACVGLSQSLSTWEQTTSQ